MTTVYLLESPKAIVEPTKFHLTIFSPGYASESPLCGARGTFWGDTDWTWDRMRDVVSLDEICGSCRRSVLLRERRNELTTVAEM